MLVTINRFRVSAEEARHLEAAFGSRSRTVDRYEGFLGLEVLRSFEPEPELLLVTRWRDRECMKAYFQSEDFKATRAASARQDATFTLYEVVAR
ncbi:antibiotic biosynthesis monooxygenase family protein [Melittangium boletus]|uniref:Antibiotic biosynthesis monooxygenase n=1 Tax=Melittangium boletus DSM 14713 TaxID=1294270 RepID=A0A250IK03_9BACT|nr:antibiotic biosynthesis monooxygenase family protein [Melittangium boletus]ATB31542.1 antibiotic biosynthesis monooxygenase [Melittangium boletus DSM 14713]